VETPHSDIYICVLINVLMYEDDDGVYDELAVYKDLESKRHHEYKLQHARRAKALARPEPPNLAGQVCFTPSVPSDEVDRACRRLQITQHEDYLRAHFYIVQDVTAPDVRLLWPAMLDGKLMCDPEFIVSNGARGTSLKYKAATQIARAMHITPNFAAANPVRAAELLYHSSARVGSTSRWIYIEDKVTFLQTARKANTAKKPTQVIVFMTTHDEAAFAPVKLRFTAGDAFATLAVVDRRFSATGMTGRGVQFT
jgi:hypothetical protein